MTDDLYWFGLQVTSFVVVLILTNYLNAVDRVGDQARIALATVAPIVAVKVASLVYGDVHRFIRASSLAYVLLMLFPLGALTIIAIASRCLKCRAFGQY